MDSTVSVIEALERAPGLVVPLVLWLGLPGAILATAVWLATRLTGNIIILRRVQA